MLERLTEDERAMLKQLSRALAFTQDCTVVTMIGAGAVALGTCAMMVVALADGNDEWRVPAMAALGLGPVFLLLAVITRRFSNHLIYGVRAGGPALLRRLQRIMMASVPTGLVGYACVIGIAISTADPVMGPNWLVVCFAALLGLVANITPVSLLWTMLRYRPFLTEVMYFAAPRVGPTPDALDELIRAGAFKQAPGRRGGLHESDPERHAAVIAALAPGERADLKAAIRRLSKLPGYFPLTGAGLGVGAFIGLLFGIIGVADAGTAGHFALAVAALVASPVVAVCGYAAARTSKNLLETMREGSHALVRRLWRLAQLTIAPTLVCLIAAWGTAIAFIDPTDVEDFEDLGVFFVAAIAVTVAVSAAPWQVVWLLRTHASTFHSLLRDPLPRVPGCEDALDVFVAEACNRKRRQLRQGPARPPEIVETPPPDYVPGPPERELRFEAVRTSRRPKPESAASPPGDSPPPPSPGGSV